MNNNLKRKKMTLNYIKGCTADNLTIDGIEVSELPYYEIVDIIHYIVSRRRDKKLLEELLGRLIESDKKRVCSISHCDQCGDYIYNYVLEI